MSKALIALVTFVALIVSSPSEARHRSRCDGVHGCLCGVTAARLHGLPTNYRGHNLKMAVEWKRAFPRTSPGPGAVVYQRGGGRTGHVFTIVRMVSERIALVRDDKGTYERDIYKRGGIVLAVN